MSFLNDAAPPARRFLAAWLVLCVLLRMLFFVQAHDLGIEPASTQITLLTLGLLSDLGTGILLTFIVGCLLVCLPRYTHFGKYLTWLFCCLLILIYLLQIRAFTSLYLDINYTLLASYFHQGISSLSILNFVQLGDVLILSMLCMVIYVINQLKQTSLSVLWFAILLPIYYLGITYGATQLTRSQVVALNPRQIALYSNPLTHLVDTYLRSRNTFNQPLLSFDSHQSQSVRLIDPIFMMTPSPHSTTPPNHPLPMKPLNIVVFILESVNSDQAFMRLQPKQYAMPFLRHLAHEGVHFDNHYASGNISAHGQFSLLTGLYPNPTPVHFEMRDHPNIPSLADWVGKQYDSFFVTASNDLYYAKHICHTFSRYANAHTIDPTHPALIFNMFMDEPKAYAYFANQLETAKPPFLGIYWSSATHYPYPLSPTQQPLMPNVNRAIDRYHNNLYLLDQELEHTYAILRNRQLLDNTIFVVVGDHGELFGQHEHYMHGRTLYEGEIKVPLVILAPHLHQATIKRFTNHIDVLPTILDMLHIAHHDRLQGESLFAEKPERTYTFSYSDHDAISAVDSRHHKMIVSFSENNCQQYNIQSDPYELHPTPCEDKKQLDAILKFRHYQPRILARLTT